jgi:hypothetical protein
MREARVRLGRGLSMISLVGLAALAGCATVPMAAPADSARLKRQAPPPDAALVYLYRNESIGAGVHMDVQLDGRPAGQTVAMSYMVWQVPPGSHRLVSIAENDYDLTIDTEPGRRYFVWQEVKLGIMFARSRLQQVSASQGQAGVDECELVQMPLPPPPNVRPPPPAPAPAAAPPPAPPAPPTS